MRFQPKNEVEEVEDLQKQLEWSLFLIKKEIRELPNRVKLLNEAEKEHRQRIKDNKVKLQQLKQQ